VTDSPKDGDQFVIVNWGGEPLFVTSCPYDLLKSEEVHKIWVAHKWFDKSSFFQRYPDPSVGLVHAVEAWELGRAHKEAEDWAKNHKH